jgi:hypothetical protein
MKLLITFILVSITFQVSLFSQKLDQIDHGTEFYKLKDMSYIDFKMKCKSGWNGYYAFENDAYYESEGYANSKFQFFLKSADYNLEKLYKSDIISLSNEFHKNHNNLYSEFKAGSKKAYNYMMLHIEKFELISNYYKDIYNYNIERKNEDIIIQNKMDSISKASEATVNQTQSELKKDEKLNNLVKEKTESLKKITSEYDEQINQLENKKKSEIDALSLDNYTENKNKIVEVYDPQINKLKQEKKAKIVDAESFWNDKIGVREKELNSIMAEKRSEFENNKIAVQNSERNNTKSSNDLASQMELTEMNYEKSIKDVDEKIKELLGNNKIQLNKLKLP